MPTYLYRCSCGTQSEARRAIDQRDDAPCCASCGTAMRRALTATPVVFKGSGFYRTDSRT